MTEARGQMSAGIQRPLRSCGQRTAIRAVILSALICGLLLCFCACGKPDDIDISAYADQTIQIIGASDEPVEISVADLKEMECETIKTHSTSDKIGDVRATGPWLDTVLEPYGMKQADCSKIIITGADEYDTKLLQDYLKGHPIMLAYGIDGEPLEEDAVPCRIIIRYSDSAYWVRQVTRIELVH